MTHGALEDNFAQREIKSLIEKFEIERIIETGSYFGWSAKIFSTFVNKVDSIELNRDYFSRAKRNLEGFGNVNLHLGDSVKVMRKIIDEDEKKLLIFLDAHWQNHWPILDELNVIKEKKLKPVICIHDFFVPNGNKLRIGDNFVTVMEGKGSKFGYDQYKSTVLNFDYIKESIEGIFPEGFSFHYNNQVDLVDSGLIFIYPNTND